MSVHEYCITRFGKKLLNHEIRQATVPFILVAVTADSLCTPITNENERASPTAWTNRTWPPLNLTERYRRPEPVGCSKSRVILRLFRIKVIIDPSSHNGRYWRIWNSQSDPFGCIVFLLRLEFLISQSLRSLFFFLLAA